MTWPMWALLAVLAGMLLFWFGNYLGALKRSRQINRMAKHYFRGLNYLLNEQPDKALEVFLRLAETNEESIETQFAVAHLFRKRGEVDRAIRIHQNLLAKPQLSQRFKVMTMAELGEDYLRAGLFDRAETLFTDLLDVPHARKKALQSLVSIHQAERDWGKAIKHASQLIDGDESDPNDRWLTSHFYCELAEQAKQSGAVDDAKSYLANAQQAEPENHRIAMMEASMAIAEGQHGTALERLERAVRRQPKTLALCQHMLDVCYQRMNMLDRARQFYGEMLDAGGGVSAMLGLASIIEKQDGANEAGLFLLNQLRQRPSIRGLSALLVLDEPSAHSKAELVDVLKPLLEQLSARKTGYRCQRCGFEARLHHWQCPSCKSWGELKPMHTLQH